MPLERHKAVNLQATALVGGIFLSSFLAGCRAEEITVTPQFLEPSSIAIATVVPVLTPELMVNGWAGETTVDKPLRNIKLLERTIPYLVQYIKVNSPLTDQYEAEAVDRAMIRIIENRGSPDWALDYRSRDYRDGFFTVNNISSGKTSATVNKNGYIKINPEPVYYSGNYYKTSSLETQKIITDLEYTGAIVKEGGFSKLFEHIKEVKKFESDEQLYQYFKTTKGAVGIGEAITHRLLFEFWSWVFKNPETFSANPALQKEIVRYARMNKIFFTEVILQEKIDFNEGFP